MNKGQLELFTAGDALEAACLCSRGTDFSRFLSTNVLTDRLQVEFSNTLANQVQKKRARKYPVLSITEEREQVSAHKCARKPINQHSIFILQPCKHCIDFLSTQLLKFQKPKLLKKPIFLLSKSQFWLLSDNILLYHSI